MTELQQQISDILQEDTEQLNEWFNSISKEIKTKAEQAGFDTSKLYYHGSPRNDIEEFKNSRSGRIGPFVYLSDAKGLAKIHKTANARSITQELKAMFNGRVYKCFLKHGKLIRYKEMNKFLKQNESLLFRDDEYSLSRDTILKRAASLLSDKGYVGTWLSDHGSKTVGAFNPEDVLIVG